MANEIPVYMITGFLEGGKTSFLKFTLQQDYFNDGSKTLLILCEEGETELDQEFMDKYHVVTETIEEESELNREYFREVGKRHKPDRVIIEYNGMCLRRILHSFHFHIHGNCIRRSLFSTEAPSSCT